jgi:predicted transposase YbfD/YdcC
MCQGRRQRAGDGDTGGMSKAKGTDGQALAGSIEKHFGELRDPRVQGRCAHPAINILTISLLAMMSGQKTWEEIEFYGKLKRDWLGTFLELPEEDPIPSDDTIRRFFSMVNPKSFGVSVMAWLKGLQNAIVEGGGDTNDVAIDGKVLRGSAKADGSGGICMVMAWATDAGMMLGITAADEKSNEITAIPELLKALELMGKTVSIDAAGCQKAIAQQIVDGKGDYVLAVKGNQPGLQKSMRELFDDAINTKRFDHYAKREKGHGRDEERIFYTVAVPKDHPMCEKWAGLRTLIMTGNCRHKDNGSEGWEYRMYISSRALTARIAAERVRGHWKQENNAHWLLDTQFEEDAQRVHDRTAAATVAILRRAVLSILKQDPTKTEALKHKHTLCLVDNNHTLKVLRNMLF